MVNVECVTDFNEQPDLHLSFYYNGVMHNVNIKLPVSFSSPLFSFKFRFCHCEFCRSPWTSSSSRQKWMARRSSPGGKISACLPRLTQHSTKTCYIFKPTLSTYNICSGEPKDLQGGISDGKCGGNKDETYWLWLPATRRWRPHVMENHVQTVSTVQGSTRTRTTLCARASFTREQSRLECCSGSNPINKLRSRFPSWIILILAEEILT